MKKHSLVIKAVALLLSLICCVSIGFSVFATTIEDDIAYSWALIGPATSNYNCLWYATQPYKTNQTQFWEWPWGPVASLSSVKTYMSLTYGLSSSTNVSSANVNNVFCYGSSLAVTHFSRRAAAPNGLCVDAKWGSMGVYRSIGYNPYKPAYYGSVVCKFYK